MDSIHIGREPIFDSTITVIGYELILKDMESVEAGKCEQELLLDYFEKEPITDLVHNSIAYIPLSADYLLSDKEITLSPEKIILEIGKDSLNHPSLSDKIEKLLRAGYSVSIHNSLRDKVEDYDIITFNLRKIDIDDLQSEIDSVVGSGARILIKNVNDKKTLDRCIDMGCQLFQGAFLSNKDDFSADKLNSNQMAIVQLVAKMQDPDITIAELEKLVMQDVALTYKLLRHINSAAFSLNTRVESIGRAIAFLGLGTIKQWVMIMAMSSADDKPDIIMENALIRSKMCECLAKDRGDVNFTSAATVGLLSSLDTLLGRPLNIILEDLPLSEEINSALIDFEGPLGTILYSVILYEQMDLESIAAIQNIDTSNFRSSYVTAISWASNIIQLGKS